MSKTLAPSKVTARDPKGLKFMSVVEAAYNKAGLTDGADGEAQRVNDTPGLADHIAVWLEEHRTTNKFMSVVEAAYNKAGLTDGADGEAQRVNGTPGLADYIAVWLEEHRTTNKFKDEEVRAAYGYPKEYKGPKPIEQQIKAIAEIFNLDSALALEHAKKLPVLPEGAEGWFAIPSVGALAQKYFPEVTDPAEKYCRALQLVLQKIAKSRSFKNWRDGQIDTAHIRVTRETMEKMNQIAQQQKGDILIIAAQLGKRHGGRSVRRAREVFVVNEYGLTSVAGGSIVLVHPERLVRWGELNMDMAGNEFFDDGNGQFGHTPSFYFGGGAAFGPRVVSSASDSYGSASGFVSQ